MWDHRSAGMTGDYVSMSDAEQAGKATKARLRLNPGYFHGRISSRQAVVEHQPTGQFFAEDAVEVSLGFPVEKRFEVEVVVD